MYIHAVPVQISIYQGHVCELCKNLYKAPHPFPVKTHVIINMSMTLQSAETAIKRFSVTKKVTVLKFIILGVSSPRRKHYITLGSWESLLSNEMQISLTPAGHGIRQYSCYVFIDCARLNFAPFGPNVRVIVKGKSTSGGRRKRFSGRWIQFNFIYLLTASCLKLFRDLEC